MIEKIPAGSIEFGKEECCAVAHAFAENKEAVAVLEDAVDSKKLRVFADILVNTEKMRWVPSEENKTAYEQIILAELSRLGGGAEPNFRCKHSKDEHISFLNSALQKVKTQTH